MKLTKEDEQAINEIVKEPKKVSNISEEHHLTTEMKPKEVTTTGKGMGIEGLEGIPAGMIAVPFVRLIQPSSKNTKMADGKEAPYGSFLFNDTQEAYDELEFVLFGAKLEYKKVDEKGNFVLDDYQGETRQKAQVSVLGMTIDEEKIFILSLSPTSFSNWGRLMAKFKALHVDKSWRFAIKATATKQENEKGKYAVADFAIGEEITGKNLEAVEAKVLEYRGSLDRVMVTEEE